MGDSTAARVAELERELATVRDDMRRALGRAEWRYDAEVVRWVDADTVDVRVDLGFDCSRTERLRILGIDAPEVRGPERERGIGATLAAASLAPPATRVVVETKKDRRGKYGRYLARVYAQDGQDVGEALVEAGHARRLV